MTMKEEQGKYGMKIAIRFCAMALTVSVLALRLFDWIYHSAGQHTDQYADDAYH